MIFEKKIGWIKTAEKDSDEWISLSPIDSAVEKAEQAKVEAPPAEVEKVEAVQLEPPKAETPPPEPVKTMYASPESKSVTFESALPPQRVSFDPSRVPETLIAKKVEPAQIKKESAEEIEEKKDEIDFRLERLMPSEKKEDAHTIHPEMQTATDESDKAVKKELKPWEIDIYGRPLTGPSKEPTAYERWIDEKRQREGITVVCPKCGAKNIDLSFVAGEKCRKCGSKLEEFENIEEKMAERDERFGVFGATRLSLEFGNSPSSLAASLAIPRNIVQDPLAPFEYSFSSSAPMMHLLYLAVFVIGCIIVVPSVLLGDSPVFTFIIISLVIIIGISLLIGFANAVRVTGIRTDENGVTFSGWSGSTKIDYGKIISISNDREVNSSVRLQSLGTWLFNIIMFLTFGWLYLIYYYYYSSYSDSRDLYSSGFIDNSSSSPFHTNNITITTNQTSVNYSFTGHWNLSFVRALAIIIFMAKRKNRKCRINPASIKAAEKGAEHYQLWRNYHGY